MNYKITHWSSVLADIALGMNRTCYGVTKKSPYEVMFGRPPRWNEYFSLRDRSGVTLQDIGHESPDLQHSTPDQEEDDRRLGIDPRLLQSQSETIRFREEFTFELEESPPPQPSTQLSAAPTSSRSTNGLSSTANPTAVPLPLHSAFSAN